MLPSQSVSGSLLRPVQLSSPFQRQVEEGHEEGKKEGPNASGGVPIKVDLPGTHPLPQDRPPWPPVSQGQEVAPALSQLCITKALVWGPGEALV